MRELNFNETQEVSGGVVWVRAAFEIIGAAFIIDDAVENIEIGFAEKKAEILAEQESNG